MRIGGKGTVRRKVKKAHKETMTDDKKIISAMKKVNSQPLPGIQEVNMFHDDGTVTHIRSPQSNNNYINIFSASCCDLQYIYG